MQRFLPGGAHPHAFDDVIGEMLDEFRRWLLRQGPDYYLAIGLRLANYLIENERPKDAIELLGQAPGERCRARPALPAEHPARQRLHAHSAAW